MHTHNSHTRTTPTHNTHACTHIRYGWETSASGTVLTASSSKYSAEDLCESPAIDRGWFDPGTQHTVVIKSVPPGKVTSLSLWSVEVGIVVAAAVVVMVVGGGCGGL